MRGFQDTFLNVISVRFLLIIAILILWPAGFVWSQSKDYRSLKEILEDTTSVEKNIPLSMFSRALTESNQIIDNINQNLAPPIELLPMDSILKDIRTRVEKVESVISEAYLEESEFINFNREIPEIEQYVSVLENFNRSIEEKINNLEAENTRLDKLVDIWKNSVEQDWYDEVSQVMQQEVNVMIRKAAEVDGEITKTVNGFLESQVEVNNLKGRIENILQELNKTLDQQDQHLLLRNAEPIWRIIGPGYSLSGQRMKFNYILKLRLDDLITFYRYDSNQIFLAVLFFILTQAFFYLLMNLLGKMEFLKEMNEEKNVAVRLLRSNWSAGTLLSLTVVFISLKDKPFFVSNLLYLVSLIPLYVLTSNLVEKKLNYLVKFLFLIFFLTLISEPFLEFLILRRIHFAILNLLIMGWLWYLNKKEWFGVFENNLMSRAVILVSRVFVIVLIVSLLANIWGSFHFTTFITFAIAGSFFYALLVYLLYMILIGIATLLLFSKPGEKIRIIRNHRSEIEARVIRVIRIVLISFYAAMFLKSFELLDDIFGFFGMLVDFSIHIGDFSLAVGDILLFMVILMMTKWISDFVVFILTEQIYDKSRKKKDLAASVSSLVKFTIITAGFLLGVVAIGFELDKLTILLSAFGVGIGFGLQNIFNNLVSGIIMVFEKPLQVGDVVEVGQLIGEVKKIGIRSSIVRTYDGSEVIVPNGNLISNELINWTHSDMQRRLIVKVGVEYGTDPDRVLELLTKVAENNPVIMKKPKPYALFTDFGDSSLNFELRCWTDDFDDWLMIISQLRVQVNQALQDAGITIPFPQRDVHIYSDKSEEISGKPMIDQKDE